MGCYDCIQQAYKAEKNKMLVIRITGSMPDGLVELCKLWGIMNEDC